jgi:hypothetical protein
MKLRGSFNNGSLSETDPVLVTYAGVESFEKVHNLPGWGHIAAEMGYIKIVESYEVNS